MKEKALGICQINTEFKKKKRKTFVLVLVPIFFMFYWHRSGKDLAASELFLTDQGGPSESLYAVIFVLCFGDFINMLKSLAQWWLGFGSVGWFLFLFLFFCSR